MPAISTQSRLRNALARHAPRAPRSPSSGLAFSFIFTRLGLIVPPRRSLSPLTLLEDPLGRVAGWLQHKWRFAPGVQHAYALKYSVTPVFTLGGATFGRRGFAFLGLREVALGRRDLPVQVFRSFFAESSASAGISLLMLLDVFCVLFA